jgi:hypothetical protein
VVRSACGYHMHIATFQKVNLDNDGLLAVLTPHIFLKELPGIHDVGDRPAVGRLVEAPNCVGVVFGGEGKENSHGNSSPYKVLPRIACGLEPDSVGLKDLLDMETAFDARATEEGSELPTGNSRTTRFSRQGEFSGRPWIRRLASQVWPSAYGLRRQPWAPKTGPRPASALLAAYRGFCAVLLWRLERKESGETAGPLAIIHHRAFDRPRWAGRYPHHSPEGVCAASIGLTHLNPSTPRKQQVNVCMSSRFAEREWVAWVDDPAILDMHPPVPYLVLLGEDAGDAHPLGDRLFLLTHIRDGRFLSVGRGGFSRSTASEEPNE